MHPLGYYLGVPKQTEVLLLTLVGICCTIFDASLLNLSSNLHKVWEVALDPTKVSGSAQVYLKYLLSGIVLVRTFSVHLYLAFYIVMLWPAIFEERPALLLPWLIVGAIKCLGMGFMALCTGLYTCISYGLYRPVCIDFVLAQIIDHLPSFYMWLCVLSYYRELKMCTSISFEQSKTDIENEIALRRRKVRSLADSVVIKHHSPMIDEDRHLISVSTIENIVQQITTDLHRKTTRSLDSLLGVMAAEAEKEELMNVKDDLPFVEETLTIQEKTAKMLKITDKDISEAQKEKKFRKYLFSTSMMCIKKNATEEPKLLSPTKPPEKLKIEHLRTTKSEKGNTTTENDAQCNTTTDFMAEIAETEMGNVVIASARSLFPVHEEKAHPQLKDQKAQIEPALDTKQTGTEEVQIKTEEPVKIATPAIKKLIKRKTFSGWEDFSCQASTLSRNVLEKSDKEKMGALISQKAAQKKMLSKPAGKDSPKTSANTPKREAPKKKSPLKDIKEIMPAKFHAFKPTSTFKADGYTLAYMEKLQIKKQAGKLIKYNPATAQKKVQK